MHLGRVALIASLLASPALAQSKKGTWEGFANTQNGQQPLTMVLDSAATGWTGSLVAPNMGPDAVKLVELKFSADTLRFGIPVNGMTVYVEGLIAGSKFSGALWVQNSNAGSLELTRKADAEKKPPF